MHRATLTKIHDNRPGVVQKNCTCTDSTIVYQVLNNNQRLRFFLINMGQTELCLRARFEADRVYLEADCFEFSLKQNECYKMNFPLQYTKELNSYGSWNILDEKRASSPGKSDASNKLGTTLCCCPERASECGAACTSANSTNTEQLYNTNSEYAVLT